MTATPLWFGPAGRPLFGWVHEPDGGKARGSVVLCHPLARERFGAHSTFVELAEALARAGLVAVRFDYDGTGDSSGGERDPDRVEAWLTSLAEAVALARRCGPPSVSLVGMRIGALLAAAAAPRLGPLSSLVLWDPCPSARSFIREQLALQRLRLQAPPADGEMTELPGHELTAATVTDLSALGWPDLSATGARFLVLERPGRRSPDLLASLPAGRVDTAEALGQDRLLDSRELHQVIPRSTATAVVDWLGAQMAGDPVAVSVPAGDTAVIPSESGPVTERVLRLGPAGLFGIETTGERVEGTPTLLMLNTGNDWHAGPNRLWTDLSRRWARLGFCCVRFDESGLGDSPPRPGRPAHVIRAPEAFDDVADATAAVSPEDPGDVVLVGLCSGAYQALEHALHHRPRGVCAINPVLKFQPPELADGGHDPRRRICRPPSTTVRVCRSLPAGPLRRLLRGPVGRLIQHLDRRRSARTWVHELADNGVAVLMVGGHDELRPVLEAVGPQGRLLGLKGRVELEVVPGLDHALLVADHRRQVADRLTEHLVETFLPPGPVPQGAGAPAQRSAAMTVR